MLELDSNLTAQGGTVVLTMSLANGEQPYAGINARLTLPVGVTLTNVTRAGILDGTFNTSFFQAQGSTTAAFLAYSGSKTFGTDGQLLQLTFHVGPSVPLGEYAIPILVPALSDDSGSTSILPGTEGGKITVSGGSLVTLTMAKTGQGSTSPPLGPNSILKDSSPSITAAPANGWRFDHWEGGPINGASTANPNSVTMNMNKTVTAVFIKQTTLTMQAPTGSGTVSPIAGEYAGDIGRDVPLKATPSAGWRFDHWEGTVNSPSSATTSVNMITDKTVRAVFLEGTKFKLTVQKSGEGIIVPAAGEHEFDADVAASINATPAVGWEFDKWQGPVEEPATEAVNSVLMDGDKTVIAIFKQLPIVVTSPNTKVKWKKGTKETITWTHAPGTGDNVKIQLLKNGTVKKTLANKTANDGEFEWNIPTDSTVPAGKGYKIRVVSKSNSDFKDTSDKAFKVTAAKTLREEVLPLGVDGWAHTSPEGPLAVRLTGETAIDAGSVWATVEADGFDDHGGRWISATDGDNTDGWVVYEPVQPFAEGAHITVTVGANTIDGQPIESVTEEFSVSTAEGKPLPEVVVTETRAPEPKVRAGAALSAPYRIGPSGVLDTPQTIQIPVPTATTLDQIEIQYFSESARHTGWYSAGDVVGWLVPDSLRLSTDRKSVV